MEVTETFFRGKEFRDFYRKIKRNRKLYSNVSYIRNDHEGNLFSDKQRAMSQWRRHFYDLLNERPLELGEELGRENEEHRENETDEEPSFEDEILDAINELRCNKARGADGLSAELIKCGGNELMKDMQNLFITVWTDEVLPDPWAKALICPIFQDDSQKRNGIPD
ncbi:uncharacterized protein [Halyomorpha halys]|uniref:uncharacterized protein n=1 Tax=Halyomorpha halys TaxID=286706 RepID=UPI0034D1CBEB